LSDYHGFCFGHRVANGNGVLFIDNIEFCPLSADRHKSFCAVDSAEVSAQKGNQQLQKLVNGIDGDTGNTDIFQIRRVVFFGKYYGALFIQRSLQQSVPPFLRLILIRGIEDFRIRIHCAEYCGNTV